MHSTSHKALIKSSGKHAVSIAMSQQQAGLPEKPSRSGCWPAAAAETNNIHVMVLHRFFVNDADGRWNESQRHDKHSYRWVNRTHSDKWSRFHDECGEVGEETETIFTKKTLNLLSYSITKAQEIILYFPSPFIVSEKCCTILITCPSCWSRTTVLNLVCLCLSRCEQ